MHDDILFRHLGSQSHLIQNQWLMATPKIKIIRKKELTHTPPTVDNTITHKSHCQESNVQQQGKNQVSTHCYFNLC